MEERALTYWLQISSVSSVTLTDVLWMTEWKAKDTELANKTLHRKETTFNWNWHFHSQLKREKGSFVERRNAFVCNSKMFSRLNSSLPCWSVRKHKRKCDKERNNYFQTHFVSNDTKVFSSFSFSKRQSSPLYYTLITQSNFSGDAFNFPCFN